MSCKSRWIDYKDEKKNMLTGTMEGGYVPFIHRRLGIQELESWYIIKNIPVVDKKHVILRD